MIDDSTLQLEQFRLKGVHLLRGRGVHLGDVRFDLAKTHRSGLLLGPKSSHETGLGVVRALVDVPAQPLFHPFHELLQICAHVRKPSMGNASTSLA
jgi:hypothetical protein